MMLTRRHVVSATVLTLVLGASTPAAFGSPGTGLTVTTLVTANLNHTIEANGDRIQLRTNVPATVRVQNIVFAPHGRTGWHHHPGIVIVAVQSGVVTVWDSECNPTTYGPGAPAGAVFTESGDERLQVTSGDEPASVYATYIVPQVEPTTFRIEAEAPSCD